MDNTALLSMEKNIQSRNKKSGLCMNKDKHHTKHPSTSRVIILVNETREKKKDEPIILPSNQKDKFKKSISYNQRSRSMLQGDKVKAKLRRKRSS